MCTEPELSVGVEDPRVAAVGEHTAEVLKEIGMSDAVVANAAAK